LKKVIIDAAATTSTQGVASLRIKTMNKQQTPNQSNPVQKPTEQTSIGGIAVGNKNAG